MRKTTPVNRLTRTVFKQFQELPSLLCSISSFWFFSYAQLSTIRRRNLKKFQIAGHFEFVFEGNSGAGKSRDYCNLIVFLKRSVFKMFSLHTKPKSTFSNSSVFVIAWCRR